MKAFIIILVVAVAVVLVGLSVYYFIKAENGGYQYQTGDYSDDQMAPTSTDSQNNANTTEGQDNATTTEPQDIMTTASKSGSYKIFAVVALQAGLKDALKSGGPYTVFAPNSKVFGKLDQATAQRFGTDKQFLISLVKDHMVSGAYSLSDLAGVTQLINLNGKKLTVSSTDGVVMIGGAKITEPDIIASNGIIQGIDSIIINK